MLIRLLHFKVTKVNPLHALTTCTYTSVPGGKVNILGGHSIGHSKQRCLYEHVSYSEKLSEIELFECTTAKLLIRKRDYVYVLFLIPVFIVRVTELVQFVINVRKIPPSTSIHFAVLVKTWRVVRLSAS